MVVKKDWKRGKKRAEWRDHSTAESLVVSWAFQSVEQKGQKWVEKTGFWKEFLLVG